MVTIHACFAFFSFELKGRHRTATRKVDIPNRILRFFKGNSEVLTYRPTHTVQHRLSLNLSASILCRVKHKFLDRRPHRSWDPSLASLARTFNLADTTPKLYPKEAVSDTPKSKIKKWLSSVRVHGIVQCMYIVVPYRPHPLTQQGQRFPGMFVGSWSFAACTAVIPLILDGRSVPITLGVGISRIHKPLGANLRPQPRSCPFRPPHSPSHAPLKITAMHLLCLGALPKHHLRSNVRNDSLLTAIRCYRSHLLY